VAAIDIPLADAPVQTVDVKSPDGIDLTFAWRHPKGNAMCPAIVFLHGGGQHAPFEKLKRNLLNGSVQTRFLAKGFAVVECTRRPFWKSPGNDSPVGFYDAVKDTALILEKVKTLPGVDKTKVALYGGSGGGILAIVTASQTDVACVIAGEPAVVVPLAPDIGGHGGVASYRAVMDEPGKYFTGARKNEILAWMQKIACPVLVLQGKSVGLYKANFEVLIPEMKKLGKDISSMAWPEVTHGFYFGGMRSGATPELIDTIVKHSIEFIGRATKSEQQAQGSF
jgi:dipeptidyl aminopeptidase/acylaminoacyl peptidase